MRQLPRQARRQPGFAHCDELGQPLRLVAMRRSSGVGCQLLIRAAPARVPGSTAPGGELRGAPGRGDVHAGEQGVEAAGKRQPAGQPARGVHRPVVRNEPLHLDQAVPSPRPPGAIAGRDQRRARHPGGIKPVPDSLNGLQPGRADRGTVHPDHQLPGAAADQQVQVQAAAQVTAGLAGDRPPGSQHPPQFRGHHGAQAAPPAARVIHTRHGTRTPD